MLKQILIKTTEQKVLAHLLKYSGGFLYNKEIADALKINATACSQSLKKLYAQHFLVKKEIGRNILYAINENSPYTQALKSYVAIFDLETLVYQLQPYSKQIIIFGSVAKGLYNITESSDMDIFIIANQKIKAQEIVNKFVAANDYFLMPKAIIKSETEYIKMQEKDRVFLNEINRGITLWKRNYDQGI